MSLADVLDSHRVVVTVGSGGVGKTTTAAAMAVHAAMEGGKVLCLTIDPARREVSVAGQVVETRTKEFDLLLTLVEHKGIVLSREQLLNLVWGYDFYGQTRTVDVHVAHLRKRIAASNQVRIDTVPGLGYKLVN